LSTFKVEVKFGRPPGQDLINNLQSKIMPSWPIRNHFRVAFSGTNANR